VGVSDFIRSLLCTSRIFKKISHRLFCHRWWGGREARGGRGESLVLDNKSQAKIWVIVAIGEGEVQNP